jgi:hypothetical protein
MSILQRTILAFVPGSVAEAMEHESRQWMMRCDCGHERSIWEVGGIRYKAAGNPRRLSRCPSCNRRTWHEVYNKAEQSAASTRRGTDAGTLAYRAGPVIRLARLVPFLGLTIVGAANCALAIGWITIEQFTASGLAATEGTVVRVQQGRAFAAYVVDGASHEVASIVRSNLRVYSVGQRLGILYDPAQPDRARLDTFFDRRLLPAAFGAIGLVLATAGCAGIILGRRTPNYLSR